MIHGAAGVFSLFSDASEKRKGIKRSSTIGRCFLRGKNRKTNLCFGGENFDTLFATCGDKVYKRKLKVTGANAFQPPHKPAPPRL